MFAARPHRARTVAVDVWLARPDRAVPSRLRAWGAWLAADEQEKAERLATDALRREYVVTRALSRWALSRSAAGVAPAEWRFGREPGGKPFVAGPAPAARAAPRFNLSNAPGLVACAIAPPGVDVGVDVEPLERGEELLRARAAFFAAAEQPRVDAGGARHAVELWTLKEAFLKSGGQGITRRPSRITIAPGAAAVPEGSRFTTYRVEGEPATLAVTVQDRFVLAIAVGEDVALDLRVADGLDEPAA